MLIHVNGVRLFVDVANTHRLRFERLSECGHDIHGDDPERVFGTIRAFIASEPSAPTA